MPKRVLITGGAGFIGCKLLDVIADHYEVTVIDSLDPQVHGSRADFSYSGVKFFKGNICSDLTSLLSSEKPFNAVVHLAAQTGTAQSMQNVVDYYDQNVLGSIKLLEFLKAHSPGLRVFLFASSRSIYGEGAYNCKECEYTFTGMRHECDLADGFFGVKCPVCHGQSESVPTPETASLNAVSHYANTKLAVEGAVRLFGAQTSARIVNARLQNVFGPGQSLNNPYTGILGMFYSLAKGSRDLSVYENGEIHRDFISVYDVVEVLANALENDLITNEINVGSGRAISLKYVATSVAAYFSADLKVENVNRYRLGDVRSASADITRLLECIPSFSPRDFNVELTRYLEWADAQSPLDLGLLESVIDKDAKGEH
jgi:dTDP-L-rhamnose 4-epimerase